jgi:two-component system sensor histidine kinase KdpD
VLNLLSVSQGPVEAESSGAGTSYKRRRGSLRIYLGAAPGVGKTFAMLNEGWRAKERGRDVVVGFVEFHGRAHTSEQVRELEVIPRRPMTYKGAVFEEMDVDAILARNPERALIDELAHTNVPGSRNEKRYQDVEELLDAGIDVISTLNIQHLESINDVVERITGVRQRETIPDEIVRSAEQVELVDITPEALRRRMAHGNIYAAEKVDAALSHYFREGNLGALRELALMWVADQVDVALEAYRERHGITEPWETRERVVVAVTGSPSSETPIRRAARMAQRTKAELLGVHVRSEEGLAGPGGGGEGVLERNRKLLEELGGEYHEVAGGDVAAALVDFARAENATQLVLGETRRSRWAEMVQGSVINRAIRLSGPIDVHVISHDETEEHGAVVLPSLPRRRAAPLPPRRRVWAWLVAAVCLPLLTLLLAQLRDEVGLPGVLLLYLLVVVATAAAGGAGPALAAAVAAFLLANWYFTPPFYTWTIAEAENLLALLAFLVVAGVVSWFVSAAARRAADAHRAAAEAETLALLAGSLTATDPVPVVLEHLRSTFRLESAALLRRDGDSWQVEAAAGEPVPDRPEGAAMVEELAPGLVLVLIGNQVVASERHVFKAFAAQLAAGLERRRLGAEASRASALSQANELRSALLQAVSHDLRTPLASIKACVSTLRQHDIEVPPDAQQQLLGTVEEETDRLTGLVANLLSLSRLQAGALVPELRPVSLEEVVPAAVAGLGERSGRVVTTVAESLPAVRADPALLERVVANLVENAVAYSPPDQPARVEAWEDGDRVELRVIDRGPGIPVSDRERVFEPFQRLNDSDRRAGVGLGLAVARGFTLSMGGEIAIEDTPGGGTTMIVSLASA